MSNLIGKLWHKTYNEGYECNPEVRMPTCKKNQNTLWIGDNDLHVAEPRTETRTYGIIVIGTQKFWWIIHGTWRSFQ